MHQQILCKRLERKFGRSLTVAYTMHRTQQTGMPEWTDTLINQAQQARNFCDIICRISLFIEFKWSTFL